MSDLITISQAAERCHVSPRAVQTWMSQGVGGRVLPKHYAPNGFHVRIDTSELDDFDQARRARRGELDMESTEPEPLGYRG